MFGETHSPTMINQSILELLGLPYFYSSGDLSSYSMKACRWRNSGNMVIIGI